MFSADHAFSGFSVTDIEAARKFYGDTLGIAVAINEMGILELTFANGTRIIAYPKDDHVPATFTVLNFPVDDVGAAAADLAARGVELLRYPDMPHDELGVVHGWGPDIGWFTDPSGNVLSILKG